MLKACSSIDRMSNVVSIHEASWETIGPDVDRAIIGLRATSSSNSCASCTRRAARRC
jgi:hypothetical protein